MKVLDEILVERLLGLIEVLQPAPGWRGLPPPALAMSEQGRLVHQQALRLRHLPSQQTEDREAVRVEVTAVDHLLRVANPGQPPEPPAAYPAPQTTTPWNGTGIAR